MISNPCLLPCYCVQPSHLIDALEMTLSGEGECGAQADTVPHIDKALFPFFKSKKVLERSCSVPRRMKRIDISPSSLRTDKGNNIDNVPLSFLKQRLTEDGFDNIPLSVIKHRQSMSPVTTEEEFQPVLIPCSTSSLWCPSVTAKSCTTRVFSSTTGYN